MEMGLSLFSFHCQISSTNVVTPLIVWSRFGNTKLSKKDSYPNKHRRPPSWWLCSSTYENNPPLRGHPSWRWRARRDVAPCGREWTRKIASWWSPKLLWTRGIHNITKDLLTNGWEEAAKKLLIGVIPSLVSWVGDELDASSGRPAIWGAGAMNVPSKYPIIQELRR